MGSEMCIRDSYQTQSLVRKPNGVPFGRIPFKVHYGASCVHDSLAIQADSCRQSRYFHQVSDQGRYAGKLCLGRSKTLSPGMIKKAKKIDEGCFQKGSIFGGECFGCEKTDLFYS